MSMACPTTRTWWGRRRSGGGRRGRGVGDSGRCRATLSRMRLSSSWPSHRALFRSSFSSSASLSPCCCCSPCTWLLFLSAAIIITNNASTRAAIVQIANRGYFRNPPILIPPSRPQCRAFVLQPTASVRASIHALASRPTFRAHASFLPSTSNNGVLHNSSQHPSQTHLTRLTQALLFPSSVTMPRQPLSPAFVFFSAF